MLKRKFDFESFRNLKDLDEYTAKKNTLPPEIQKVYKPDDFPIGYNEDAQLIDNTLWKLDGDSWKEPEIPLENISLFSKEIFEKHLNKNRENELIDNVRTCEIIYKLYKKPIAVTKKEYMQLNWDFINNTPPIQTDENFNAFLEEDGVYSAAHPKTDKSMYPVPVGYIVRDKTQHYRKERTGSCNPNFFFDREEVLETYCIFDFVLEELKESVDKDVTLDPSNANQRLNLIPTGKPQIQ